jgi:hypothetical protein
MMRLERIFMTSSKPRYRVAKMPESQECGKDYAGRR